jgi:hypothetical protein
VASFIEEGLQRKEYGAQVKKDCGDTRYEVTAWDDTVCHIISTGG